MFTQPGVQADFGETQGRSLAISIYGSTSAENLFLIDGVNTTNVIKGFQGKDINTEFIQEVEVKTGGYQAEYGRNTGGVVNVITKSGGNDFHGGIFGYYNDTGMRAEPVDEFATLPYSETGDAQFTNNILSKDVRQEWGADLGGFMIKDKIWFFGAYDRVQVNQNIQTLDLQNLETFGHEYPVSYVQNKYSGKLTLNPLQGTSIVGTVFSDAQTQLGALRTPLSNIASTYAGRQDVGGPDYGARLNQLFGSFGIFTFQYAQHKDRYATIPEGADRQAVLDYTVSPNGTFFTRDLSPDNPAYPPGFGSVPGPTRNNESQRQAYAGFFTSYLGNHEVKVGGDYQHDNTTGATYFTGGSIIRARPCLQRGSSVCDLTKAPSLAERQRRQRAGLLRARPARRRDPERLPPHPRLALQHAHQSLQRLRAGPVEGDPDSDAQPRHPLGHGILLRARPHHRPLQGFFPDEPVVAARRRRMGFRRRRHVEALRLGRTLLLRDADGPQRPRLHGQLGRGDVQLRLRLDHAGRRRAAAPALPGRQRGWRAHRRGHQGVLPGRGDHRGRESDRSDAFRRPQGNVPGPRPDDRGSLRPQLEHRARLPGLRPLLLRPLQPGRHRARRDGTVSNLQRLGQSRRPECGHLHARNPAREWPSAPPGGTSAASS